MACIMYAANWSSKLSADADVTGIGSRALGKALAHIDRTMLTVISAPLPRISRMITSFSRLDRETAAGPMKRWTVPLDLHSMMGSLPSSTIDDPRARPRRPPAGPEGKRLGRPPLAPELRKRIPEALKAPGSPGVRKIAAQFGGNASTVQQISSGL
jgi:hypothetical protein